MKVDVPYGKEHRTVEIADKNLVGVYYPNEVETKSADETINSVLREK